MCLKAITIATRAELPTYCSTSNGGMLPSGESVASYSL